MVLFKSAAAACERSKCRENKNSAMALHWPTSGNSCIGLSAVGIGLGAIGIVLSVVAQIGQCPSTIF